MKKMEIAVSGNTASVTQFVTLVSGTVGLEVGFVFDQVWDSLRKTAVFRANGKVMDCVSVTDTAVVPWELLKTPGCRLWVGLYGTKWDGSLQIPTVWVDLGVILPGADPSGDETADPTLPVWDQVQKDTEAALDAILRMEEQMITGAYVMSAQEA